MKISELGEELAAAAVELWHACGLTRPWNDPLADLERALAGPSSTVLAATDLEPAASEPPLGKLSGNGTLIGTVMVGHDGHRGWIYYLAVVPDRQGQGLGKLLLVAAEAWLRDRDVPKVQLMVRTENNEVIGFYEALGYEAAEVVVLGRRLDDRRQP